MMHNTHSIAGQESGPRHGPSPATPHANRLCISLKLSPFSIYNFPFQPETDSPR